MKTFNLLPTISTKIIILCSLLLISGSKSTGSEREIHSAADLADCIYCPMPHSAQLGNVQVIKFNMTENAFFTRSTAQYALLVEDLRSDSTLLFDTYALLLQFSENHVFGNEALTCSDRRNRLNLIKRQHFMPYNFEVNMTPREISNVKRQMSSFFAEKGDYVSSLSIASEIQELEIRSLALRSLVMQIAQRSNFDVAAHVASNIETDLVRVLTLNYIAHMQLSKQRREDALATISDALTESNSLKNSSEILIALSELAISLALFGEKEAANLLVCHALGMVNATYREGHEPEYLVFFSQALAFLGEFSESLHVAFEISDPWLRGQSLRYISFLHGWAGDFAIASETISYIEIPWLRIAALSELSAQKIEYGDLAGARVTLSHAMAVVSELDSIPIQLSAFRLINGIETSLSKLTR